MLGRRGFSVCSVNFDAARFKCNINHIASRDSYISSWGEGCSLINYITTEHYRHYIAIPKLVGFTSTQLNVSWWSTLSEVAVTYKRTNLVVALSSNSTPPLKINNNNRSTLLEAHISTTTQSQIHKFTLTQTVDSAAKVHFKQVSGWANFRTGGLCTFS